MAAQIIDLPRSDDNTFPVISGIPLADADPAVIAHRLGDKPWEERVWFFNNIVAESLERMIKISDHAMTEADGLAFLEWAILKMHERIGQVIDHWGEAKPGEDLAAAIYALSLNPQHRLAARGYFKDRGAEHASRQFHEVAGSMEPLRVFYNLSELSRPGLSQAWRDGVPEACGALIDVLDGSA